MSDTATVPTDEQLKEYAAQLPDLYKDILAAYQYLDPSRDRGDGLYEEQLQNFLWNEATRNRLAVTEPFTHPAGSLEAIRAGLLRSARRRYPFTQAVNDYGDEEFAAAIDRLIENEFLRPRTADVTGRLVPTPLGERVIEILAGKPPPAKKAPDLPKPTWR